MRVLITYHSDTGNTEKIAQAISDGLAEKEVEFIVKSIIDTHIDELEDYDVVGVGGPVKYHMAAKEVKLFLNKIPKRGDKAKAFVFCTYGGHPGLSLGSMKRDLKCKGYDIIGEFSSVGCDSWSLFKLIGGMRKGRPNKEDLAKAKLFGSKLRL